MKSYLSELSLETLKHYRLRNLETTTVLLQLKTLTKKHSHNRDKPPTKHVVAKKAYI